MANSANKLINSPGLYLDKAKHNPLSRDVDGGQFECCIHTVETALLLKESKFTIDIRQGENQTPTSN